MPRLGLRPNLFQFSLLVTVNALVGGMVGQEQTVLPLLARQQFHLTGYTFLLTYVLAFGLTKAASNYLAGQFAFGDLTLAEALGSIELFADQVMPALARP